MRTLLLALFGAWASWGVLLAVWAVPEVARWREAQYLLRWPY